MSWHQAEALRRNAMADAIGQTFEQRLFEDGAVTGSLRLLERQISTGCVMPEAMIRWQQRHGVAA